MTAKDAIREIMALRKWSQATLAEEAGLKRQSNITGILNRGVSLRVDTLVLLAEAMGCEVVIRDKMGSKMEWRISEPKSLKVD